MSNPWTYQHKQANLRPYFQQPQKVPEALLPESNSEKGRHNLQLGLLGHGANQQLLQETKVDRLSSLPPDFLHLLCQKLSVRERTQRPNWNSNLTPHKAEESGSVTLDLLALCSCCKRLADICKDVFTSLHYTDSGHKQLEPFLRKHPQIDTVSLGIYPQGCADIGRSLATLYSILPGLTSLNLHCKSHPLSQPATSLPCTCRVDNIDKLLLPWVKTLRHLELAHITCISSATPATSGMAFLPQLTSLQALCLHEVDPLVSVRNLAGCTGLLKLTLSARPGGRLGTVLNLDVSSLVLLQELFCANFHIKSINVAGLKQLRLLNCTANGIHVIDLSTCTAMSDLRCGDSNLVALDLTACTQLMYLACGSSAGQFLSDLRLSSCTRLKNLHCSKFTVDVLDLSLCTDLCELWLSSGSVGSLKLGVCLNLQIVDLKCCTDLDTLDLAGHSLKKLSVCQSSMALIDVSGCTMLEQIKCSDNATLATLSMAGCCRLGSLELSCCVRLHALDLTSCTSLHHTTCHKVPRLIINAWELSCCTGLLKLHLFVGSGGRQGSDFDLDVSVLPLLQELLCANFKLKSLCVRGLRHLRLLNCTTNNIPVIDVSTCTTLRELQCWDNPLGALDVSACHELVYLACGSRSGDLTTVLANLCLSGCTQLTHLHCSNLGMAVLEVSNCTSLLYLYMKLCIVHTLDLAGLSHLKTVDIPASQFTLVNASGCTSLVELRFDGCTAITVLSLNGCSMLEVLDLRGFTGLQSLDLYGCTSLQNLNCQGCPLRFLDLASCVSLVALTCSQTYLRSLDLSPAAQTLRSALCSGCRGLKVLCAKGCWRLATLFFDGCPVQEVDVEGCRALMGCAVTSSGRLQGEAQLPQA